MAKEIKTEILINAAPEKVWSILTNFEKYPDWNPFIKSINGLSLRVTRECVNTSIDIHPSELEIEKLIVDYELLKIGSLIPPNIVQEKLYCKKEEKNELLEKLFSQKK